MSKISWLVGILVFPVMLTIGCAKNPAEPTVRNYTVHFTATLTGINPAATFSGSKIDIGYNGSDHPALDFVTGVSGGSQTWTATMSIPQNSGLVLNAGQTYLGSTDGIATTTLTLTISVDEINGGAPVAQYSQTSTQTIPGLSMNYNYPTPPSVTYVLPNN